MRVLHFLFVMAVSLFSVPPVEAQNQTPAKEILDAWDGVWGPGEGAGVAGAAFSRRVKDAPLTPEYAAKRDAAVAAEKEGRYLFQPQLNCIPEGMPYFMANVYGMEILTKPNKVTMISEYMNLIRHIPTDGRPLPQDPDRTFVGTSVGKWEGDTLVVDTIALPEDGVIAPGLPHSDEFTIRERIRLIDKDTLRAEITLTDPKALTRPWVGVLHLKRAEPGRILKEYVCVAGNRERVDENGVVTRLPWFE